VFAHSLVQPSSLHMPKRQIPVAFRGCAFREINLPRAGELRSLFHQYTISAEPTRERRGSG
jgi:hypothetical protein